MGKIITYKVNKIIPLIKFLTKTTCVGNISFLSNPDFVYVWKKVNRATLIVKIITPTLNSNKLNDPSVIAINKPIKRTIQKIICTLEILFSLRNITPNNKAKIISLFNVRELFIAPAMSKPIYKSMGITLNINPIVIRRFKFFFFFHPFNKESLICRSKALFLFWINFLLFKKYNGKKINASTNAVIAANIKGSITDGLAIEITGCKPIRKTPIEPKIIPFLKL